MAGAGGRRRSCPRAAPNVPPPTVLLGWRKETGISVHLQCALRVASHVSLESSHSVRITILRLTLCSVSVQDGTAAEVQVGDSKPQATLAPCRGGRSWHLGDGDASVLLINGQKALSMQMLGLEMDGFREKSLPARSSRPRGRGLHMHVHKAR